MEGRRATLRRLSAIRSQKQTPTATPVKSLCVNNSRAALNRTPLNRTPFRKSPFGKYAAATPLEIRLPLIAYLAERRYDRGILDAARKIGSRQQIILADICEVENAYELVESLRDNLTSDEIEDARIDLPLIQELKRQFVLTLIRNPNNKSVAEPLKTCLLRTVDAAHDEIRRVRSRRRWSLTDAGISPRKTLPACAVQDGDMGVSTQREQWALSIPELSITPATPVRSQDKENVFAQPKANQAAPTPHKQVQSACLGLPPRTPTQNLTHTPIRPSPPLTSAVIRAVGETPLCLVRSNVVRRAKVSTLQQLCETDNIYTPVRLEAQSRLSVLAKSNDDVSSASNEHRQPGGSVKRRREATTPPSKRRCCASQSSVTTTGATGSQPDSVNQSDGKTQFYEDPAGQETAKQCTSLDEDVDMSKAEKRLGKRRGSAGLLGAKSNGHLGKYQSRVARNARTQRTKEWRSRHSALQQQAGTSQLETAGDAGTAASNAEALATSTAGGLTSDVGGRINETKRSRRRVQIAKLSESKFLKQIMSVRDILREQCKFKVKSGGDSEEVKSRKVDSDQVKKTAVTVAEENLKNSDASDENDVNAFTANKQLQKVSRDKAADRSAQNDDKFERKMAKQLNLVIKNNHGFHPGQLESVRALVVPDRPTEEGVGDPKDSRLVFVRLPTGYGKSLIYQLSSWYLSEKGEGLSIVIFPTLPLLLTQQKSWPSCLGMNVRALHGEIDAQTTRATLISVSYGLVDVLLATPEQFVSKRLVHALTSANARPLAMVAVDEAHCLSEWGHSFRPAYQHVVHNTLSRLHCKRLLLTTATASQGTINCIAESLRQWTSTPVCHIQPVSPSRRDDLTLTVSRSDDILTQVVKLLKAPAYSNLNGVILVYTWMKWLTQNIAHHIQQHFPNRVVVYYHSGMEETEKARVLESMMSRRASFVVATQSLGIGVDFPHVAAVVHTVLPATLEQYLQEIGRANRTHAHAHMHIKERLATTAKTSTHKAPCHLFLNDEDYARRHQQISGSTPDALNFRATAARFPCTGNLDNRTFASLSRILSKGKGVSALEGLSSHLHTPCCLASVKDFLQSGATDDTGTTYTQSTTNTSGTVAGDFEEGTPAEGTRTENAEVRCDGCLEARLTLIGVRALNQLLNVRTDSERSVTMTSLICECLHAPSVRVRIQSCICYDEYLSAVHAWRHRHDIHDEEADADPGKDNTGASNNINDKTEEETTDPREVDLCVVRMEQLCSVGLLLRCFKEPLEKLRETSKVWKWLFPYMTVNASSGTYKLMYARLFACCENHKRASFHGVLYDFQTIEQMIYDQALEHSIKVEPIEGESILCVKTLHWSSQTVSSQHDSVDSADGGEPSHLETMEGRHVVWSTETVLDRMCNKVLSLLQRNNGVSLNRLDAAYAGFAAATVHPNFSLQGYLDTYFKLDAKVEELARFDPKSVPYLSQFTIPSCSTIRHTVEKGDVVECARVTHAISNLVDWLKHHRGYMLPCAESLQETQIATIQPWSVPYITPIMISRVLVGLKGTDAMTYKEAAKMPGWNSLKEYSVQALNQAALDYLLSV